MLCIGKTGIMLATVAVSSLLAIAALEAAPLSHKQALAACRAKFGLGVTDVVVKKNGHIMCQEGPGRNATRQDVYDYCKKRYSATTVQVRKKPSGKWECRYYGRF